MMGLLALLIQECLFFWLCDGSQQYPKPLTRREEAKLLAEMAEGSEEARRELILHNLRLVAHIARKYTVPGHNAEDLTSIGVVGLIKAVGSYRQGGGTSLGTYAARCIENAIPRQRVQDGRRVPSGGKIPKWHVLEQISRQLYLLCLTWGGHVRYAPLYIHRFRLVSPRKLLEAQQLHQQYRRYEEIRTVPERLRWCRHHLGLMQKEVAERIGISRSSYLAYEMGEADYYPREIVDKLAALYGVPADDLLDDFSRFLYHGQGQTIRKHRESLGLERKPYARLMHIGPNSLRAWETEKKQISRNSWEKYFKGIIKM